MFTSDSHEYTFIRIKKHTPLIGRIIHSYTIQYSEVKWFFDMKVEETQISSYSILYIEKSYRFVLIASNSLINKRAALSKISLLFFCTIGSHEQKKMYYVYHFALLIV